MKTNPINSGKQKGLTLVESIAAIGVASVAAAGIFMASGQYMTDTRTIRLAEHMRTFADAVNAYVNDNRAVLVDQASAVMPVLISGDMLRAAGYLEQGFDHRNKLGQTLCALVVEPASNRLQTLVVAEGGDRLDDISLADFVTHVGQGGGGRYASDPAIIRGSANAWAIAVSTFENRPNLSGQRCDGSAGPVSIEAGTPVVMQWSESSVNTNDDYLFRHVVPGNPDSNRMETHLGLGGHSISNLNTVTIGADCGAGVSNGEVASSPKGEVASCVSGKWSAAGMAYWSDSVDAFTLLPPCNASRIGETRRTNDLGGVYVCTGTHWDAGLTTTGQFVLPGQLRLVGNMHVGSSLDVGGNTLINGQTGVHGTTSFNAKLHANAGMNVGAGKKISSPGEMQINANGNLNLKPFASTGNVIIGGGAGSGHLHAMDDITSHGAVTSEGRLIAGEHLLLNKIVTENSACDRTGLIARNNDGLPLSCQSGRWSRQGIKTTFDSLKYTGQTRYDGWYYKPLTRQYTRHWCKKINLNLTKPSFVFISLYGVDYCNLSDDCRVSTHIFDTYRPKVNPSSENLLAEHQRLMSYAYVGIGSRIQSTTSHIEYTSGAVSYEMCIGSSRTGASPSLSPTTNYSFTIIE